MSDAARAQRQKARSHKPPDPVETPSQSPLLPAEIPEEDTEDELLSEQERNLLETIKIVCRSEIERWAATSQQQQPVVAKPELLSSLPSSAMLSVGGPLLLFILSSLLQSGVPQDLLQAGLKRGYESLKNSCVTTGSLDAPSEEPLPESPPESPPESSSTL